jgi:hypothetical protein
MYRGIARRGLSDASPTVARASAHPNLFAVAGFEWGTGFYINPVPPEQVAQFLAETEVDVLATPPR